jgi:catechol 2,3-dioxygenase-like lactoylglutathione lyase family enzyme
MSALWPARLHHLRRDSPEPERLARFYGELLGDQVERMGEQWLVSGPERRMLIGEGKAGSVPHFAFQVAEPPKGEPCKNPLFQDGASVLLDPDGRQVVFGIPKEGPSCSGLPGRLQHFVCASTRLPEMVDFYRGLGMVESDRVMDGDLLAACFLRSDPEHHSFAAFRAPESRADHHCYETTGWMDIRDWADRMGSLRIKLWWGPGRHGPGNNLFFMVEDPDGYKVEFSAELEHLAREIPFRTWPHEERTLNLWGNAWMRS